MASNLILQTNGSNVAPTNIGNNCQYNFIIQFDVTSGELIGVVTDGPEIMQNEDTLHFFSESLAIAVAKTGSVVSVGLEIVPSSDAGNTAVIGTDGRIYVPAGGGGGLADQDTILGTGVLGDEFRVNFVDNGDGTYNIGVNVIDTNVSLVIDTTLLGDGTSGNPLGVRISTDAGNQLTTGTDGGLYVPDPGSGVSLTTNDAARATLVGTVLNIPDSTPFARIVFQDRVARRATAVAQVGVGNEGNAITTYAWTGVGVTFGTPAAATTTISVAAPGTYTLQLVVTDTNSNTYTTTRVFTAENVVYINSDDSEYLVIDQLSTAWTQLTNQGISGGTIKINGTSTMTSNFVPDDEVYIEDGRLVGDGTLRSLDVGSGSPVHFSNMEISGSIRAYFSSGGIMTMDNVLWNTDVIGNGFVRGSTGTVDLDIRNCNITCEEFSEDLGFLVGNKNITIANSKIFATHGIESGSLLNLIIDNSSLTVTEGLAIDAHSIVLVANNFVIRSTDVLGCIVVTNGTSGNSMNLAHGDVRATGGNAIDWGTSSSPSLVARYVTFADHTQIQSIGRDVGSPFAPTAIYKCLFLGPVEAGFTVPGAQDNLVV